MQDLTGILIFLFMLLVPTTLLIFYTVKNRVPQIYPLVFFFVWGIGIALMAGPILETRGLTSSAPIIAIGITYFILTNLICIIFKRM